MKKIFSIFLLVFIVFSCVFKVSGNTAKENLEGDYDIIAEVGSGSNSDLFSENVKEVSGTVDWDKIGNYEVVCIKDDGDFFIRNVLVRDEKTLIKGIDVFKDIGSLNFEIKGLVDITSSYAYPIKENTYYTFYNCLLESGREVSYICKYQKNEASKVTNIFGEGKTVKLCFFNNYIYALINVYEKSFVKIQINKYDSELNLLSSNRFVSNSNDEAIDLFISNNYMYVLLNTSSNEGIIDRTTSNKIALILKLNPINYVIEDYLEIGNNYDNELMKCQFDNNKFTVFLNINGSSGKYFHTINKSYSGYFLLSISSDLSTSILKSVENECLNYECLNFNSKENLMIWKDNDNKISIKYGAINDEKTISIAPYSKKITSIKSLIIDNKYYIFIGLNSQLSKLIYINNGQLIERNIENVNLDCSDIYVYNNKLYLKLGSTDLRLYSFENIKMVKKEVSDEENNEIKTQLMEVQINDESVEVRNENEILSDKFGSHYSFSKCVFNNYLILYKSKYTIPLKVNIRENELYDPGITLVFNGHAKLNNEEIESNYKVNNIGKYQLEIYGENNEKEIINFEIVDECTKEVEHENTYNDLLSYMGYEKSKTIQNPFELNISENQYQDSDLNDYIIIIVVLLVIAYIVLFKFLKRLEKKI